MSDFKRAAKEYIEAVDLVLKDIEEMKSSSDKKKFYSSKIFKDLTKSVLDPSNCVREGWDSSDEELQDRGADRALIVKLAAKEAKLFALIKEADKHKSN